MCGGTKKKTKCSFFFYSLNLSHSLHKSHKVTNQHEITKHCLKNLNSARYWLTYWGPQTNTLFAVQFPSSRTYPLTLVFCRLPSGVRFEVLDSGSYRNQNVCDSVYANFYPTCLDLKNPHESLKTLLYKPGKRLILA